jgi:DNA polymerase-3 subunit alpha
MQFIPSFIKRKHGEEEITYLHPKMENSLQETYGVLVYQEQFMNISKDLCGFTGGEADYLRKAVAKKKADMMAEIKPKFIDGALKNNPDITRDTMELFWSQLEEFANYCFNKAHAACYALIGYWTAYLKAHYPAAFMAALMTSDANNIDRLSIEIAECNRLGIKVLNPDINESFPEFAVVPESDNIRFGLGAVKNVGSTAIDDLLAQRALQKFSSIEDFARRVNSRVCNRKVWEALIKAGAFDSFAEVVNPDSADDVQVRGDRSDLLFNLDAIIAFAQKVQKEAASGQEDLFGLLGDDAKTAGAETHLEIVAAPTKIGDSEKLGYERELLGLYLSSHPLDKFDTYLREQTHQISTLTSDQDGSKVVIGGLLSRWRVIQTKSGGKMAFAAVEDKTGEIETVIFPKLFETLPDTLDIGLAVKITGKVSGRDRDGNKTIDPSIIADEVLIIRDEDIENYKSTGVAMGEVGPATVARRKRSVSRGLQAGAKTVASVNTGKPARPDTQTTEKLTYQPVELEAKPKLYIHVKDPSDGKKLEHLRDSLKQFPGDDQIILVLGEDKKDALRMPFTTSISDNLTETIGKIYGAECVAVK